jgi:hypothetical protein
VQLVFDFLITCFGIKKLGNQRTLDYNFMEILRIKEHAVLVLSKKTSKNWWLFTK